MVIASENGLLFQFEGENAAKARISLTDMRGRAVWRWSAIPRDGARIFWNGQAAAPGIYVARVDLLDVHGRSVRSIERRISFMR